MGRRAGAASSPNLGEGRWNTMLFHEYVSASHAADVQRDRLGAAEHHRLVLLAAKHRKEENAANGHVDRRDRLQLWLAHQLTWPRWPRPAVEPV